ncbi:hypothetical protein DFJ63DRAFT_319685 [Scheffersomyces coipomensis]|uniref:uncharacterized protein n=1 Tax=Scheffersomyces coipomensis TaxID=1788519 RepID=UPI00315D8BC1
MLSRSILTRQLQRSSLKCTPGTYHQLTRLVLLSTTSSQSIIAGQFKLGGYNNGKTNVGSRCNVITSIRGYATSSNNNNNDEDDYEIDLITLKKTPKVKPVENEQAEEVKKDNSELDDLFNDEINHKGKFQKYKSFEDVYLNAHDVQCEIYEPELVQHVLKNEVHEKELDFVYEYFDEINIFLTFIQKSYSNKIRDFEQLTYIEFSNCLYIFKNYYMNNKINSIKAENIGTYNRMFDQFLAFLKTNHEFPTLLTQELVPEANELNRLISVAVTDLYFFIDELDSLNKEFGLQTLSSVSELSDHINNTLKQFDQFSKYYLIPDSNYIKISLQIKRYNSLKSFLDANEGKYTVDDLLLLVENKEKLKDVEFDVVSETYQPFEGIVEYYQFLGWKYNLDNNSHNFLNVAPILFQICQDNHIVSDSYRAASYILQYFVSYISKGYYSFDDASSQLSSAAESATPLKIYDAFKRYARDPEELYLISKMFQSGLPVESFREQIDGGAMFTIDYDPVAAINRSYYYADQEINESIFKHYYRDNEFTTFFDLYPCIERIISTPYLYKIFRAKNSSDLDIHDTNIEIPDEIYVTPFKSLLAHVRLYLFDNQPFGGYTSDQVLKIIIDNEEKFMKIYDGMRDVFEDDYFLLSRSEKFAKLVYYLKEYFKVKPNQTFELDKIADEYVASHIDNIKNLKQLEMDYLQIPEAVGLYKFGDELYTIMRLHFDKSGNRITVENFINQLRYLIDVSYDHFPSKFLNPLMRENHLQYKKLLEVLDKAQALRVAVGFAITSKDDNSFEEYIKELNPEVFDTRTLWDTFDLEPINTTYIQIPEDLKLHQFHKELKAFGEEILECDYAEADPEEILAVMDHKINQVYKNADKILVDDEYYPVINDSNVCDFVRLQKRLSHLFSINGGNTEVLDTLINSQSAFEEFEKSKPVEPEPIVAEEPIISSSEYKQIPDDFFLEEYVIELIQLKEELNGVPFKDLDSNVILAKLLELSNGDGSISKKIVWSKLYRNLSLLFKINGNETFILDNVLINGEEFIKFESKKSFNNAVDVHENSWIGENSKLINNNFQDIEQLLTISNLKNKDGIWNLSPQEFTQILTNYADTYDKSSYNYPIVLNLMETLKTLNAKLDYYPNFLQQLYEIKSNNVNKKLTELDVEDIYKAFIEKLEYEESQKDEVHHIEERIICPSSKSHVGIKPIYERTHDIDDAEIAKLKAEYNDSEQIISNLIKAEDSVDLDHNEVLSAGLHNEESIIKEAISNAVKETQAEEEEQEAARIVAPPLYKKFDITSQVEPEEDAKPIVVDKFSLEHFLKDAKTSSELEDERKFRQDKAFEWSHSMCHSNRSLESHNFFDPLDGEQNFNQGKAEFLLLTLEGQAISCDAESIGKLPKQDIFKFLNKFDNFELELVMRSLRRLQRSNWKLIGSKVEGDQKYLILSRTRPSTKRRILTKIKTLFATAGAVFLTLAGLNVWLGDTVSGVSEVKEIENGNKIETLINQDAARVEVPITAWAPERPTKEEVVERATSFGSDDDSSSSSSSYWKSILWSGK